MPAIQGPYNKYVMATCYTVIQLALAKIGVTAANKTPRQADLDLGLTTLQALYRRLVSSGMLGRAHPVRPHGNFVARENDRIQRKGTDLTAMTLPDYVVDDYACDDDWGDDRYYDAPQGCARPRAVRDGAWVVVNDAVTGGTAEYIYEAYVDRWISFHDLSLANTAVQTDANGDVTGTLQVSDAPLSYRDINGLAAFLAVMLADYFGATPSAMTVKDAENWKIDLTMRLGEPEPDMEYNTLWDWGPRCW